MLVWLAPLALLAACSGTASPERTIASFGDSVQDAFSGHANAKSQTLTFPGPGTIGVDVEVFAGDVEVIGDPTAKEIVVTIDRESTHGFGRQGEGKDSLASVQATAELVPGDLGPTLRVRATTNDPESHFQRAHITIVAADIDGVRVRSTRGAVEVKNVIGGIDVETTGGDVRVMSRRPLTQPVTVLTSDGSIDFRVNGLSSGAFDVETIGGLVKVRCTDGMWNVGSGPGVRPGTLVATLGTGRNPVALRTTEGDVRIAVVPDPTAVGAVIISP